MATDKALERTIMVQRLLLPSVDDIWQPPEDIVDIATPSLVPESMWLRELSPEFATSPWVKFDDPSNPCKMPDLLDIYDKSFRLAYMGYSQYECGILPAAMRSIEEDFRLGKGTSGELTIENTPVYYLCDRHLENQIRARIEDLSVVDSEQYFLGYTFFPSQLKKESYAANTVGWLELNNFFMFFTDKEMYTQVEEGLRALKPKNLIEYAIRASGELRNYIG